jgi:hypothetical protein
VRRSLETLLTTDSCVAQSKLLIQAARQRLHDCRNTMQEAMLLNILLQERLKKLRLESILLKNSRDHQYFTMIRKSCGIEIIEEEAPVCDVLSREREDTLVPSSAPP